MNKKKSKEEKLDIETEGRKEKGGFYSIFIYIIYRIYKILYIVPLIYSKLVVWRRSWSLELNNLVFNTRCNRFGNYVQFCGLYRFFLWVCCVSAGNVCESVRRWIV
jgi:hypothetical protein